MADWSNSGSNFELPSNTKTININDFGGKSDNTTDNSVALQNAIASLVGNSGIIQIPKGNYLFKKTISLPSNIVIRGDGSNQTTLNFNLNGNGDLFSIQGKISAVSSPILSGTTKASKSVKVANAGLFTVGDYCVIKQTANQYLSSDWAQNYFFQLVQIIAKNENTISINEPLHLDFNLSNNPVIIKTNPVEHVGIESLKIKRLDATTTQSTNIFFNYAVQCWVKGVEMENANYAHITLQSSAFTTVSGNYLHDAFDYGSGGKGYGIVMQFGASSNFIYDNILKHLRHSILLQATANGNVIAYNYSFDPYWKQGFFPANSAGDIVLHGNYPYSNLFEGNIIQNLVIDNSHGINGPYNTFFRNRIENYGIVMNTGSGDKMNFIANEITNTGFLKGLYSISGNQVEIANNINGKLRSGNVTENTLINTNFSSKIGMPNVYNSWKNSAFIRSDKSLKTLFTTTPSASSVKEKKKKCAGRKKKRVNKL